MCVRVQCTVSEDTYLQLVKICRQAARLYVESECNNNNFLWLVVQTESESEVKVHMHTSLTKVLHCLQNKIIETELLHPLRANSLSKFHEAVHWNSFAVFGYDAARMRCTALFWFNQIRFIYFYLQLFASVHNYVQWLCTWR